MQQHTGVGLEHCHIQCKECQRQQQVDVIDYQWRICRIIIGDGSFENEENTNQAGITYDSKEYTVTVEVVDDKQGSLVATVTHDGHACEGLDLNFTNTYKAASTEVYLSGNKTLTGNTLEENKFSFVLSGKESKTPLQTVSNATNGDFAFSKLTFNKEGTYEYTVRENVPVTDKLPGVTYDTTLYDVVITVTDDGSGQLKATTSISDNKGNSGILADGLDFTNTYEAGTTSVTFGGIKTLNGFPENADSKYIPTFEFTLSEKDKVIDTTTVSKDGLYGFKPVTYDKEGTYTYTIKKEKERQGFEKGIYQSNHRRSYFCLRGRWKDHPYPSYAGS